MSAPAPTVPALICELCRLFYGLGWVSGTGGGVSIRGPEGIYIAPSGVQKERLRPADIFLLADVAEVADVTAGDDDACPPVLRAPADPSLRISECRPLFFHAFRKRGAGAVIHSHSIWAVLAARLACPEGQPGEFTCAGLEMQKGLRGRGAFETITVPILANTRREAELSRTMAAAIDAYPEVDAVLVAGHGVYVWGVDWAQAKAQAECYDYLFRAVVEAHRLGLPIASATPTATPAAGGTQR